jgi:hypothetical protein
MIMTQWWANWAFLLGGIIVGWVCCYISFKDRIIGVK